MMEKSSAAFNIGEEEGHRACGQRGSGVHQPPSMLLLVGWERIPLERDRSNLFVAQAIDKDAGPLDVAGAMGTPRLLWAAPFYLGINDPLGLNPLGVPFSSKAFTLYRAWEELPVVP